MRLFCHVDLLVPVTKLAREMVLASDIQKYTCKTALGLCIQNFIMFSEGFEITYKL